jgi:HEPN domain-containing protein
LPRPEHVDLAHLLLRKARGDLSVARLIAADPDPHDDAIGFHAQQAVEKAIKAVLAFRQAPAPRTHDLTYLVELLGAHGIEVPAAIAEPEGNSVWHDVWHAQDDGLHDGSVEGAA